MHVGILAHVHTVANSYIINVVSKSLYTKLKINVGYNNIIIIGFLEPDKLVGISLAY